MLSLYAKLYIIVPFSHLCERNFYVCVLGIVMRVFVSFNSVTLCQLFIIVNSWPSDTFFYNLWVYTSHLSHRTWWQETTGTMMLALYLYSLLEIDW